MAWDGRRTVPWKRLLTEWCVVTGLVVVVMVLATNERRPAAYAGLLIGGLVYMAFGAALAKFGYQRVTLKGARAQRDAQAAAKSASAGTASSSQAHRPARASVPVWS